MSKLFGTDGIRGIANVELTSILALKVGLACGNVLKKDNCNVLIGCDTRISSSMLVSAISAGLASSGCNVTNIGVVPTPCVSYLVKKLKYDAGIMVSASHNSYEFNGIKIFDCNGFKLPDLIEEEIEKEIELNKEPNIEYKNIGTIKDDFELKQLYINYLLSTINNIKDMKVVFDLANGSSCSTAPYIFNQIFSNPIYLANNPNGININDNCGSTHLDNLIKYVNENNFDLGIAFDGDADRCLFVDNKLNIIDGDFILAIVANDLKKKNKLKNNTLVGTILSNLGLVKFCEENNINFSSTKVGDRYVLEEMLLKDYIIGGEQSGHIIFKELSNTGDGELTALQILQILSDENKSLYECFKIMKKYPQVSKNIKVRNESKKELFTNQIIIDTIENVKNKLNDSGRIVVRPSGTEPLVRVMLEADNLDLIDELLEEVVSVIENEIGI